MSYLTIAIPTFQRAKYLDICLASLEKNILQNKDDLEVLVIDNNSQDNTAEVVAKYIIPLKIRYIHNTTNIGPDENFKKCIREATSQYIWILGDDDVLFEKTIEHVLELLCKIDDVGLIHLKAYNFCDDVDLVTYKKDNYRYEVLTNKNLLFTKIHLNISFMSANIFNKETVMRYIQLNDIPNNNLGQVYWNLISMLHHRNNIFISSKMFGARQFNSGNYNLCEVFGNKFIDALQFINQLSPIGKMIKIFEKRLLIFYLPANIVRIRNNLSKIDNAKCFKILYAHYKTNILFWLFVVPAMILPKKLALVILNLFSRFMK